jgi:hypothetical protein
MAALCALAGMMKGEGPARGMWQQAGAGAAGAAGSSYFPGALCVYARRGGPASGQAAKERSGGSAGVDFMISMTPPNAPISSPVRLACLCLAL